MDEEDIANHNVCQNIQKLPLLISQLFFYLVVANETTPKHTSPH